jgi:hydroxymethylpyrimidine/phosphomethylpyrimidine kinase
VARGAHAALVKGGHLVEDEAIDVLVVGGRVIEMRSTRLALPATHGGGCVLASLIAARFAKRGDFAADRHLAEAVRGARRVHQRALRDAIDVGGRMRVLTP